MPRALHMRIMAVFIAAAVIAGWSQDWPQWRGSRRDGMLAEYSPPKTWPERLTQRWQVSVGEGHSSPVVVNRRIYLLTRRERKRLFRVSIWIAARPCGGTGIRLPTPYTRP